MSTSQRDVRVATSADSSDGFHSEIVSRYQRCSRTQARLMAAAYREDFVRVVANVGVDSRQAASLAEATSGRRFQACSPADLVPALAQLVALAEHLRADHFSRTHVCDE